MADSPHPDPEACALLRRCPIFSRCDEGDLAALAGHSVWRDHADGEDLVREGEPPHDLLVLERGRARVLKRGDSGEQHLINQSTACRVRPPCAPKGRCVAWCCRWRTS